MKEVPCMYSLKPVCGLQVRVELPKCMYRLRQIQGSYDASDVRRDNIMAKSYAIEEQVKILLQENPPAVARLEQRQEVILSQLRNLKCLVEELSRQLSLSPTSSVHTSAVLCMKETAPKEVLQLVVKASPSRLPHAFLALVQSSSCCGRDPSKIKPGCIKVKWHTHSTLSRPLPSLPSSGDENHTPSIQITFIWKDGIKEVEFSIGNSPVWLKGEPILMRVILSHLSSTPDKENVITDVALAALLDSCAAISDISSKSSLSSIKQAFSEANKWFSCLDLIPSSAHSLSVGEMSLWGAMKALSSIRNDGCLPQETPAKLRDWFMSYSRFLGC